MPTRPQLQRLFVEHEQLKKYNIKATNVELTIKRHQQKIFEKLLGDKKGKKT
jgi:hypothetical protein